MALALGKILFKEEDVTCPAGLKTNDAYDLTLHQHATDSSIGYLKVNMTLQMMFRSGKNSAGKEHKWDHGSKQSFMKDYKSSIYSVWDNQWDIKLVSGPVEIKTVRVFFYLHLVDREWYAYEHYEVEVYRTDRFRGSWVSDFWGDSELDSQDTVAVDKGAKKVGCSGSGCAIKQRGAVHEFGHMLGLRDEYAGANKGNASWLTDGTSVMHSGETVRPRHYSIFADWLTDQYTYLSRLAGKKIVYKVDGKWDLTNSKL